RLDPFSAEKEEDIEWLHGLQSELHQQFVDWVRARRGTALSTEEELYTGEIWTGANAARLGLTDGLGTLRQTVTQRYPDAKIVIAEPRKTLLAKLGIGGAELRSRYTPQAIAGAGFDLLEQRAHWARFGL
ncbi:MAG: S49 family peptidase, partial [Sciscionella sp.]